MNTVNAVDGVSRKRVVGTTGDRAVTEAAVSDAVATNAGTKVADAGKTIAGKRRKATGTETGKASTAEAGKFPRKVQAAATGMGKTAARGAETKADTVLKKLQLARGATVAQFMEATGWQAHSVRGFLSGTIRKKRGLNLVSEMGKDSLRRYRVITGN